MLTITPAPEQVGIIVYVVVPEVPVFVTKKSKDVLAPAATLATAPSGVTVALLTTVTFHLPVADAPVGLVDVTVICTVPGPGAPVVKMATIFFWSPGIRIPVTAGHVVTVATEPVPVQLVVYRVSNVPVLVTVNVSGFPVVFSTREIRSVPLAGVTLTPTAMDLACEIWVNLPDVGRIGTELSVDVPTELTKATNKNGNREWLTTASSEEGSPRQ